jgi:hypothetical protein
VIDQAYHNHHDTQEALDHHHLAPPAFSLLRLSLSDKTSWRPRKTIIQLQYSELTGGVSKVFPDSCRKD